jgi:hypothetical protein
MSLTDVRFVSICGAPAQTTTTCSNAWGTPLEPVTLHIHLRPSDKSTRHPYRISVSHMHMTKPGLRKWTCDHRELSSSDLPVTMNKATLGFEQESYQIQAYSVIAYNITSSDSQSM